MKHLRDDSVATIGDIVVVLGYSGGNPVGTVTRIKQVEGNDIPDCMVACDLAFSRFGAECYEFADQLCQASDEDIVAFNQGRKL